jgi:hypothetical protein
MKQPPTQGRGGGGVLGQRAFAWFLAAAIVALALLCLFYGTAFAPILRGGRDSFHLGFRARTLTGALPADLALPSIPVRNLTSRFSLPSSVNSSTRDVWCADRPPARACRGVRREALGAHPLLGPGAPLPAPAMPQPLPLGAL